MDLNRLKKEAEKGSAAAAMKLVEYYYSGSTEEAIVWANLAAETNHVCGAYWMALCLRKQIRLLDSAEQTLDEKTREYYFWSQRAYTLFLNDAAGADKLHRKQLKVVCEDAVFVRANWLYKEGEYRNAVLLLKRETSYRCGLLMGLCLLEHYRKDKNAVEEDLFAACECLSEISKVGSKATAIDAAEERIYAMSALHYAKIRRKGFYPEGEKPGVKEAYHILDATRSVVRDEDLQSMLDAEIAHYRKKFPGRYKYIE